MKERPIAYSPPMVRAILDDRKTQTRRIVKAEHLRTSVDPARVLETLPDRFVKDAASLCPYGVPGDRLWVREEHRVTKGDFHIKQVEYFADKATRQCNVTDRELALFLKRKHPYAQTRARFMYRSFSRISLEVTAVRIERLQDISEADALAEGVSPQHTVTSYEVITDSGSYSVVEGHVSGIPKAGDTWNRMLVKHVECRPGHQVASSRDAYRDLWDRINGSGSWASNPWVWAITFNVLAP